jgi:hypothetical protein
MVASTESTPILPLSALQEGRKNLLLSGQYSDMKSDDFSLLATHLIIYRPSFGEVIVIDTYEITFNKDSLGIHSRPSKRHLVNFTPRSFTHVLHLLLRETLHAEDLKVLSCCGSAI